MSAEQSLFEAYGEWRRLARAAQKAIYKKDWGFLSKCREVVRNIQPVIKKLHQETRAEWKRSKLDCSLKERELKAIILELKELLESNQKALRVVRAAAQARREEIERMRRNLRLLQKSYLSRHPSAWTSVS